jgi:hypothetical protein
MKYGKPWRMENREARDQSTLRVWFHRAARAAEMETVALPAAGLKIARGSRLVAVLPHLAADRGAIILDRVTGADARILLEVLGASAGWPLTYELAMPLELPAGAELSWRPEAKPQKDSQGQVILFLTATDR